MNLFNDKTFCFADAESVMRDCRMAVICPLGKFYPNKNYGNSLRRSREAGELLAAARLAVDNMDGVFIKSAQINGDFVEYDIVINNEVRRMSITIEQKL